MTLLILASFVLTNVLLSFVPFPFAAQVAIGLLGILLPSVYWTFRSSSFAEDLPFTEKGTSSFRMLFAFVLVVALAMRFMDLASFSAWPSKDDARTCAHSLDLLQKWDWRLFFGNEDFTSVYLWVQTGVYKILGVSLFTLWLTPAVLSTGTVLLAYAAARQFFSRSFSFFCLSVATFSFWPLYLGRLPCIQNILPPLELFSLYLLGRWFRSTQVKEKGWLIAALALTYTLGFYVSIFSWVSYWAFFHFIQRDKRHGYPSSYFITQERLIREKTHAH